MREVPPVDAHAVLPPGTPPELADWVDLLRTTPIYPAAAELNRQLNTPTEPLPQTVTTGRHTATATSSATVSTDTTAPSAAPAPLTSAAVDEPIAPRTNHAHDPSAERLLDATDLDVHADHGEDTDELDDTAVYEPTRNDYDLDKKGRRVFPYVATEGAGYVAVDADNQMYTDVHGDPIAVNRNGIALADHTSLTDTVTKFKNLVRSGGASTEELVDDLPDLYDENGVPVEHFPVGKAGRKIGVTSNKVWGTKRLAFTAAVAATACAVAGIAGIWWGRGAIPAQGAISSDEAATYRLSTMPISAMSAFGEQYLETCLTHGDKKQMKARATLLAAMSTGGATTDCGWSQGGEVQQPITITFTGRAKTMTGQFDTGRGAYLEYLVSTHHGQFQTYSVPIWVKSDRESNDMVVVGDIGITPGMRTTTPETYTPAGEADTTLAGDLQLNLLKPYLTAWAASDRTQIDLAVAADATAEAKRGLSGALKNPQIDTVAAYSNRAGDGQQVQYVDGDKAVLMVTVTWTVPSTQSDIPDSTQTAAYRINVLRTSSKWVVTDINGGAVTDHAAQANPNANSIGDSDSGIGNDTRSSATTTPPSQAPAATNNQLAPPESSADNTP